RKVTFEWGDGSKIQYVLMDREITYIYEIDKSAVLPPPDDEKVRKPIELDDHRNDALIKKYHEVMKKVGVPELTELNTILARSIKKERAPRVSAEHPPK